LAQWTRPLPFPAPGRQFDQEDNGELFCYNNDNTVSAGDPTKYMILPNTIRFVKLFCQDLVDKRTSYGPYLGHDKYRNPQMKGLDSLSPFFVNGQRYGTVILVTWDQSDPSCPRLDFSKKANNPGQKKASDICIERLNVPVNACEFGDRQWVQHAEHTN
jgi:hypothetical protein